MLEFYFDVVINIKHRRRSPPISRCDPATIQRESFPPWSTWDEIDNVEEYHILIRNHRLKNNIRAYQEGDCYWSNLSMYCLQTPVLNSVLYAYFDWRKLNNHYYFVHISHLCFFFVLICSDKIAYRTNATATPSLVPPIHLKKNSIHVRTLFRASCMFLSFFIFTKPQFVPGKLFLSFFITCHL